jgi:HK97 gp10 family phage protein
MSDFKVKGLKELEKKLLALSKEYGAKKANSALRAPLKAAMSPIVQEVKNNTPVDTGALRDSTKLRIRQPSKQIKADNPDVTMIASVGWEENRKQQIAVEYGTNSREANPVLRPALENNKKEIVARFAKTLGPSIERSARRLSKGKK